MDQIDKKILDFLQKDAKLTAKEMAHKLSLTPTPIYERIKKMEKLGIIKSYVALLNAEKVDRGLTVFLNITIKEHQLVPRQKFINDINQLQEVVELYHTSGSHDFLAKVRFANIKEYRNFLVNDITSIQNIGDIDSQIVLEEVKSTTAIIL
ncbi:MAG: Lrp/AsnC family transcriptional regulator [Salibacteraceae bacterium]